MKRIALLSLVAVLCFAPLANANTCSIVFTQFKCAFYGGDHDPFGSNPNGLANENDGIVGGSPYGAATYQNFVWGGGYIGGLFTNNLSQLAPTSAYWEIRANVSEGNGGTLLYSGTATGANFGQVATGRSDFGYTEYQDAVLTGSIFLAPGTYWFAVVPNDVNAFGRAFNSNTYGLNSIGSQISDDQFFNSSFYGANFTNANNEGTFSIFSSGVLATPEPSELIMLASGLAAAAGILRRRLL